MPANTSFNLRQRLIEIARQDVGKVETSRNQAPFIKKFWPATSYPEGYANREPYCAAAGCYWVWKWLQDPEVLTALGKTPAQAEKWRCKSARAFDWRDWGRKNGLLVMDDSPKNVLHTGDIIIFDFSHFGIVVDDYPARRIVKTIEANTNAGGSRDGDGCWEKERALSLAQCFIRLMP